MAVIRVMQAALNLFGHAACSIDRLIDSLARTILTTAGNDFVLMLAAAAALIWVISG